MSSILMEALKPQIEERDQERDRINLLKYVIKGYMSIPDAASEAGIPVESFRQLMEKYKKEHKDDF